MVSAVPEADSAAQEHLAGALDRLRRLKQMAYEDFRDGLLRREDFLCYQADYERQEQELSVQLEQLVQKKTPSPAESPWAQALLAHRELTCLDRITVAASIRQILIFEDGRIDIAYAFAEADDLPGPSEASQSLS